MLQQTQVATVIPFYGRFMTHFPDVQALAAAPLDEVLHVWTGLGYYARARNLHAAARRIVSEHKGDFPQTLDGVRSLPGIGRSTAGAILALACSARYPILDGNVKRVLARFFGIAGFPGEKKIEQCLWARAEACTPHDRVAQYTQAIMDLGATICTRSRPLCAMCPLSDRCVARLEGRQALLPTPRPKKVRPHRAAYAVILARDDGLLWLERRPPSGVWGGLWTFPQFDDVTAAIEWIGESYAQRIELPAYLHAFTHFDLTLHPMLIRSVPMAAKVADSDRHLWYDPARPAKIGLAKPAVDLIRVVGEKARGDRG